ncbi:alpha/beta hydrolase [Rhabdaerophilum sp. SD176]|uniref:alpha/beta hydrolase n=1 Tax=Rhabdaerophilum sp. SD176 TaxID=2983548 RepID=UPI0024DFA5F8|nr:alpha/beta hydrolase [Rhabdaerophilum sp. SD176]
MHVMPGRVRCWIAALAIALGAAGCASSGRNAVAVVEQPLPEGARTVELHVATTRAPNGQDTREFSNNRAATLHYAAYVVTIPPGHKSGAIEVGDDHLNPANGFTVLSERRLDRAQFEREIRPKPGNPRLGIFVHGYNTGFRDAIFRGAQMKADSNFPGTLVLFAWPSQGQLTGYLTDRDSSTYSRQYLAELIELAARGRKAGTFGILAHSMGTWLTVETVRDLRLAGRWTGLPKPKVTLAAPDIDIDVFRTQMQAIGPLDPPMTVLTSPDDRALKASSRLAGGYQRLGAMDVKDQRLLDIAQQARLRVVDISSLDSGDSFHHDRFVMLAKYQPRLQELEKSSGAVRGAGAYVFRTLGTVVSSPFQLVETVIAE